MGCLHQNLLLKVLILQLLFQPNEILPYKEYFLGADPSRFGPVLKNAIHPIITEELIPEFVGRLPVVATLSELDNDALIRILTEPKNSLTKQYTKLFEMEGVEVDFREDALQAVAAKATERKTGARGLRSILESVLLDTMYDLPGSESVSKVVIDESVINGESSPMLIYENIDQAAPKEGNS